MNRVNNFKCRDCGSTNLGYQKWVEAVMPVQIHEDGHIEYHQAVIDEDNDLGGVCGFICMDCKDELSFCGCRIQTEEELISYLTLDPADREEQEKEYQETLEAEIDRDLEEQELINESYLVEEEK